MPSTSCWPRLGALAREKKIDIDVVKRAIQELGINPISESCNQLTIRINCSNHGAVCGHALGSKAGYESCCKRYDTRRKTETEKEWTR